MIKKAAIYHFTDVSQKRPKIYKDQVKSIVDYAQSAGFAVSEDDIYCDMSLKRYKRTEFDRFLKNCNQYDALFTKDYYHISKNTGKCVEIMQQLKNNGVQIYTIMDGSFTWKNPPFDSPLRIATYTCHYGMPNEIKEVITVRNDILCLFAAKKTKWTVVDQYYDETLRQRDGEQEQMIKLLNNKEKYNLLLVHNLNDIHWRTANFCKYRNQLHMDIYSMQEGFLEYKGIPI